MITEATKTDATFEAWLDQFDATGASIGYCINGGIVDSTGPECWRVYFDEGMTPREALEADLAHADDD